MIFSKLHKNRKLVLLVEDEHFRLATSKDCQILDDSIHWLSEFKSFAWVSAKEVKGILKKEEYQKFEKEIRELTT